MKKLRVIQYASGGVGRQTINSDGLRFTIGGLMLAGWLTYFYGWRGGDTTDG